MVDFSELNAALDQVPSWLKLDNENDACAGRMAIAVVRGMILDAQQLGSRTWLDGEIVEKCKLLFPDRIIREDILLAMVRSMPGVRTQLDGTVRRFSLKGDFPVVDVGPIMAPPRHGAALTFMEYLLRSGFTQGPSGDDPVLQSLLAFARDQLGGTIPSREQASAAASVLLRCNGADLYEWTDGVWLDGDATEALRKLAST